VDKMMERIRNIIKTDKKKSKEVEDNEEMPTLKRSHKAKADELSRRYPVTMTAAQLATDYETLQQHCKEELTKSKPRDRMLLPLMKST